MRKTKIVQIISHQDEIAYFNTKISTIIGLGEDGKPYKWTPKFEDPKTKEITPGHWEILE